MRIIALILLAVGACISYGAKPILDKFSKQEYGEKEVAVLKTVGLFTALAGAIIIFVI